MAQWNGNAVNSYKSRGVINTNLGINYKQAQMGSCCEAVSGLMTSLARLLAGSGRGAPAAPPPDPAVDSDVVVILAALLCALICVVGLALVARCAWLRRSLSAAAAAASRPADKGLKKKALRALPRITFDGAAAGECAICLAEFARGDEIRVLPQCGHGFHVGCVDTWLSSHSSCPSCRRVLVVARCRTTAPESEGEVKAREDRRSRFLP